MAGPGIITLPRTEAYAALFANEITGMKRERMFTDFTITTNNESLPCHKLVIAAHSPVLKAMLHTDMVETTQKSMSLDHIKPGVMRTILDYMYDEQISFHAEQLQDIITACDFLQIKMLKDICVDHAPDDLKADNVIAWAKLGNDLDLAKLKLRCAEIMLSKFQEVSNQPDFLTMAPAEVQDYMSNTHGTDVDHDEVLSAGLRWVNHDPDGRMAHLENLLGQIKLDDCTSHGVLGAMEKHGAMIVSDLKVYNLLMKTALGLTPPTPKIPVPKDEAKSTLVIIGGRIGPNVSRVCWKVDASNQIVELCKIPVQDLGINHSVCATPQGFVITGGRMSDLCIMFLASSKSWSWLPKLLGKKYQHGSISIKGVLYVIGGFDLSNNVISKSVESLLLEGGRWQTGQDLPVGANCPLVADVDDCIYVLDEWASCQLMKLDAERNVWVKLDSCPTKCEESSMAVVNGQLCVAGGKNKMCAWYTPSTNTWCISKQFATTTTGSLLWVTGLL